MDNVSSKQNLFRMTVMLLHASKSSLKHQEALTDLLGVKTGRVSSVSKFCSVPSSHNYF